MYSKESKVLAIQSTIPDEVAHSLETIALDYLPKAKFAPYVRDRNLQYTDLVASCYSELTKIIVNSAGEVDFPSGIFHHPDVYEIGDKEKEKVSNKDLIRGIALAFQAVYQNMERILNKDLKNSTQLCNLNLRIYKASENPGGGGWHQDGLDGRWDVHLTSLIYFLHEGCDALLSLSERTPNVLGLFDEPDETIASIQTKSGMSITFANKTLAHRVHDVKLKPGKNTSLRGLLTFFYQGPATLPPQITALHEHRYNGYKVEAMDEKREDERQVRVYYTNK